MNVCINNDFICNIKKLKTTQMFFPVGELLNNSGTAMLWNIIPTIKTEETIDITQQPGWITRKILLVKKKQSPKLHAVWFHLYNILKLRKSVEMGNRLVAKDQERMEVEGSNCDYNRTIREPCGDGNVLYLDSIDVIA